MTHKHCVTFSMAQESLAAGVLEGMRMYEELMAAVGRVKASADTVQLCKAYYIAHAFQKVWRSATLLWTEI